MKSFKEFINEKEDKDTKVSVLGLISSTFYRFVNSNNDTDIKSMLLLIAALNSLSVGDGDPQSVSIAKRLATAALARSNKSKK
jgi:hypothetical protein